VPTIEGKKARLNIPAGTQSETQFRLKSKGMSILRQTRRGDMYVEVSVEIPVNLNSKQKAILQEFEKEGGTSKKHSPKSQSFFSKLKEVWEDLKLNVTKQLSNKKLYIIDAFCGANKDTCLKVRFVMEVAWQAHFVKNMFIRPSEEELKNFVPDFHVINGSKTINKEYKKHNMNSETFIAFNLTERMQLIGGTWYGGEMKKGMFAVMNYLLPQKGIASMHCSANKGIKDDTVALFFGLSGTGKTTLSTDPKRSLIGDDEHGWDDDGIFNFEGGCYAKTVNLDPKKEPDIFKAIKKDALLEQVIVNDYGKDDHEELTLPDNP